ncbi:hypothetical protein ACJW30_07G004000 [Castanea mollissima]
MFKFRKCIEDGTKFFNLPHSDTVSFSKFWRALPCSEFSFHKSINLGIFCRSNSVKRSNIPTNCPSLSKKRLLTERTLRERNPSTNTEGPAITLSSLPYNLRTSSLQKNSPKSRPFV